MTDSSVTPITAASNGGTTTDSSLQEASASPARPERGIARLREHEVYYLTSLVQSALYEAEHLISEVLGQARPHYLDRDDTTEPLNGEQAARLRETEVYHLMSLVESALSEAEHLVREVHDKARDRWLDHDHVSEPLNADELSRLLSEAYQCTTLAATYIDKAAMGLLDPAADTPF